MTQCKNNPAVLTALCQEGAGRMDSDEFLRPPLSCRTQGRHGARTVATIVTPLPRVEIHPIYA